MSKTTTTLRDFRQWLAGVEEMQGSDWHPTTEQWKKIREKIDQITEGAPLAAPYVPMAPQQFQPGIPSSLSPVAPAPAPFIPPATMSIDSNIAVKTPNIDSSRGYTTDFA